MKALDIGKLLLERKRRISKITYFELVAFARLHNTFFLDFNKFVLFFNIVDLFIVPFSPIKRMVNYMMYIEKKKVPTKPGRVLFDF